MLAPSGWMRLLGIMLRKRPPIICSTTTVEATRVCMHAGVSTQLEHHTHSLPGHGTGCWAVRFGRDCPSFVLYLAWQHALV